jgi:uncharacterized protein (TIGR01319 family)
MQKEERTESRGRAALLVDIGSTYTKVVVVDLTRARVLAQGQSVTTVEEDVTLGLLRALSDAGLDRRALPGIEPRRACSSAAGGLCMVAIGLVPALTAEAARRAALGAGALVRQVHSYALTPREVAEIEALGPDIVLLAGGTDGGEEKTILHNAAMLSRSAVRAPVIVAGNRAVAARAAGILRRRGIDSRLVENVMPHLNSLNVEPAQQAIRRVFLERIVEAKGLKQAEEMLGTVAMPTPAAVQAGAQLLADGVTGSSEEPGWGELMVVDVGGATTDVHSVAEGLSPRSNVVYRGLSEPRLKRTVEGDLGLRVNAPSLLAALGEAQVQRAAGSGEHQDLGALVGLLRRRVGHVPRSEQEWALDAALSQGAIRLAMARHVGRFEELLTPTGPLLIQRGKDLSQLETVVGTGGIFAHHPLSGHILREALGTSDPFVLAPEHPRCYLDRRYILWAAGLLAEEEPGAALKLLKAYLIPVA